MKFWVIHLIAVAILALTPRAHAESFRQQNLPAICKSLFPKLIPTENRPLSTQETRDLFSFASLPANQFEKELSRLSSREKRGLLEKLMLLRWQVPHLPEEHIPSELKPATNEILSIYPRSNNLLSQKPEVQDKLTRAILKKRIWSAAEAVASHLGSTATPQERKEMFKLFLEHFDYHDQSWHHQAQLDSLIDLASGIQTKKISEQIQRSNRKDFNDNHQGEETYSFAGPELLLTPYSEILNLFHSMRLKPGDKVVDLGAGFGRLGLALATRYPELSITGYEIVKDRITEGARVAKEWQLDDRVHLLEQNLADPQFKPEPADVYYAFNPVSGQTFDKILEDLRTVGLSSGKRFRFIVFGPSPFYKTEAQPWLKEIKGEGIPEGEELKIYEFVPEKASHTVIVDPGTITNPFQLRPSQEITHYPKTQSMAPSHLELLKDHLSASNKSFSNNASFLSPNYLAGWASGWPMEISRHGNLILISSQKTGEEGKESFIEPLGGSPQEKAKLIRKIIEDKKRKGIKAEFSFVSEPVHKLLLAHEKISTSEAPDYFDFIYPAENLAKLDKTKKLRDRGNQARSFEQMHPEAHVELIANLSPEKASQFKESIREFLGTWVSHQKQTRQLNEFEQATLETETEAAKHLVERLTRPENIQIAVRGNRTEEGSNPVIAYASGEIATDSTGKRTLLIYVQKSDGTKNAIPFINREMVQEVVNHPEKYGPIDFVNMMDGSTPGLRQFKMQYEPDLELGKTYKATFKE